MGRRWNSSWARGLSANTITRLTAGWQGEAKAFGQRGLSGTGYVYLWVEGIHLKVRLEQEKLCVLVMIGVRADGRKELVALTDGYRESTESWADLLRGWWGRTFSRTGSCRCSVDVQSPITRTVFETVRR